MKPYPLAESVANVSSLPLLSHSDLILQSLLLYTWLAVIREFCSLDMPVFMVPAKYNPEHPEGLADGTGKVISIKFGELLPLSFGPEHLDLPRGPS